MTVLQSFKENLNNLDSSVMLLDNKAKIQFANPALEYRNGFQPSEAFERNPGDLWGKNMPTKYYSAFWGQLNNQKILTKEITNVHSNGSTINESLYILKLPVENKNFYLELQPTIKTDRYKSLFNQLENHDFGTVKRFFKDNIVNIDHTHSYKELVNSLTRIFREDHQDRFADRALLNSENKLKAFAELYEKYYKDIRLYFFRRLETEHIEDLTHDVFLSALKSLSGHVTGASYKTYLLRIAHNRYIDFLRSKRRMDVSWFETGKPQSTSCIDWDLLKQRLTEKEKRLLSRHYLEGYKLKEIAVDWGVSENAIKLRISRLRKRIKGVS